VLATKNLSPGEVALAPGVVGMSCIASAAKRRAFPPMAVRVEKFGPTLSRGQGKDGDSGYGELVIMPSARLPPRGVDLQNWEEPVFVHPFWLIKRDSDVASVNMTIKQVSVDTVRTCAAGELDIARNKFTKWQQVTLPVMTNTVGLREGSVLIAEMPAGPAKAKSSKVLRWDSLLRKAPAAKQAERLPVAFCGLCSRRAFASCGPPALLQESR